MQEITRPPPMSSGLFPSTTAQNTCCMFGRCDRHNDNGNDDYNDDDGEDEDEDESFLTGID